MSKYSDLLQVIKSRVCQNNNFPQTLLADSHSYRARQVWYRIGQIFTLECILDEYRKHFSSDYYYLDNDKALHHLIFEMTKWKPEEIREVAIKWSAAPDMTPQTVLYRRPVAQFSNFQPKIVSSWLILALFQANFLISGRSRLCPYQLVNSNQVRQGE
ncbi:hypothetical protein AAHV23_15470 [Klebsiella pneumoniae]